MSTIRFITGYSEQSRALLRSVIHAVRATAATVAVPRDKDAAVTCRDAGVELVMAADQKWEVDVPTKFQWMPGGVSLVTPSYGGRTIRMAVLCDESTARAVQASFDRWRKTMPKQRPFGCVEHREQEAAFLPTHFEWDTERNGVACCGTPTALGAQNVNGRIHRSWSPTFTTDADYESCKCSDCGLGWDGCDAARCEGVMEFPDGVRGSLQNPAQVTGVAFSVGSLTNKPAFRNIDPVRARDGSVKATWSDAARKAAAEARQHHERASDGWKKYGKDDADFVANSSDEAVAHRVVFHHSKYGGSDEPVFHAAVQELVRRGKDSLETGFDLAHKHEAARQAKAKASDPGVRASGTSEGAKKGWESRYHVGRYGDDTHQHQSGKFERKDLHAAYGHLQQAMQAHDEAHNEAKSEKMRLAWMATAHAHEGSARAHLSGKPEDHNEADYLHAKAAVAHREAGEGSLATGHFDMAVNHSYLTKNQVVQASSAGRAAMDTRAGMLVRATWSDAARQAAAEARKREGGGLLRRKHEQARRDHLEEAEQAGKDYANAGTEDEMDATHKTRVAHLASAKAYETGSKVHHYAASLAHLAAKQAMDKVNDEGMGRGHLAHAQVHDALAHNETTHNWVTASLGADKDSVRAHCKDNLYADVPDATEAEAAEYDRLVDGGSSHQVAVAELRKKRNPADATVQTSDAILAKLAGESVRATWSDAAREAAAEARRLKEIHTNHLPEEEVPAGDIKPGDKVDFGSGHRMILHVSPKKKENRGTKENPIWVHVHEFTTEKGIISAPANSTHTTKRSKANVSASDATVQTSDAILAKLAGKPVTATGTSEGAKKGWESRSKWHTHAGNLSEAASALEVKHHGRSDVDAHVDLRHAHGVAADAWETVAHEAAEHNDKEGQSAYMARSKAHRDQQKRHSEMEDAGRRARRDMPGPWNATDATLTSEQILSRLGGGKTGRTAA